MNDTRMRAWRRYGATLLASVIALSWSHSALSADVTLTWEWPDSYCADADGNIAPLSLSDIAAAEIYIATAPIPRVPGDCGAESDVPPSGAIIQQVTTPDTTVTVDLVCGATYHFVMRLQDIHNAWSNFSTEAVRIVDCGRPGVPIIISLS
jgi:hypothetical protein